MTSKAASPSTTRKSFFKKPTWATSAPPTESGDFFRHSDVVYDSILKEREKRRERNAQKKQAKISIEAVEGKENKRRRISIHEGDQEDRQSDSTTPNTGRPGDHTTQLEVLEYGSTERRSAQGERAIPSNADPSLNAPIPVDFNVTELDSDNEKSQPPPNLSEKNAQTLVSDEEVSEEEDDYVLELKQKARENARLKKLGIDTGRGKEHSSREPEVQPPPAVSSRDRSTFVQSYTVPTQPPIKDEAIVQILITTRISNAKSLIVSRKVSQPMYQVRQVWCSRQDFDDEMTAKVIFTWRGKRLYDTTTSTHLLNVLKQERARQMGGLAEDDEEDPTKGMIEVEAITKDMYESENCRKKRGETDEDTSGIADPQAQDAQSLERPTTPGETAYKVVMNAQGLEALHLKVRPNTPIAKMMAAFKMMRGVDPSKTCWLVHDGDRLEPESTVGDTEIEDGDAVEVHVR